MPGSNGSDAGELAHCHARCTELPANKHLHRPPRKNARIDPGTFSRFQIITLAAVDRGLEVLPGAILVTLASMGDPQIYQPGRVVGLKQIGRASGRERVCPYV